jgi:hypothetical protein
VRYAVWEIESVKGEELILGGENLERVEKEDEQGPLANEGKVPLKV